MSSYFEHIPYKQDQAPRGGYPEIEYRRHLPRRGLSGVAMIAAGVGVMMGGFWITAKANQKRRFVSSPLTRALKASISPGRI